MRAVRHRYAAVAREPRGQFPYPVGVESLSRLGYETRWTASLPAHVVERFVGVGNPLRVRPPRRAEGVLDVGCGCGVDTLVAAQLVGSPGRAVGLDASPEMLDYPRNAAALHGRAATFVQGVAEQFPFADGSFDLVISNGALNLATDKDRAFLEIARVLVAGGEMVVADLIVKEAIPEHLLASMDAWST
jgi:ubiquinone/menaquinone biosynthesis C-methylase UbiE